MKTPLKICLLSFIIFFFSWYLMYKAGVNTLSIQSEDTIPAIFLPVTIIKEHTIYADAYYPMILDRYPHPDDKKGHKKLVPFYFRRIVESDNSAFLENSEYPVQVFYTDRPKLYHYVSAFPLMSGLLALPVYFFPVVLGVPITWSNLIYLSHAASALTVSLCGGLFYVLLNNYLKLSRQKSLLLTFVYLFGTINFAMVSQALWQQGSLQLFTILALIFFYKFDSTLDKKYLYITGFFSACAFLSRPTAILVILMLVAMFYGKNMRELLFRLVYFVMGMFLPLSFFIWYNFKYFVSIANQGYADQLDSGWLSYLPEGFAGIWISPSKGILIYSPILIFGLFGFWLSLRKLFRDKSREALTFVLFGLVVLTHTLVLAKWKHWYGGWSYGYRMASDVIPFLVFLLIPFVESSYYERFKKTFLFLFVISIGFQLHGMVFFDGVWHAAYDDGFENTAWLWSIKDSEVVFNIRRVLVKLNILETACPKCLPG